MDVLQTSKTSHEEAKRETESERLERLRREIQNIVDQLHRHEIKEDQALAKISQVRRAHNNFIWSFFR